MSCIMNILQSYIKMVGFPGGSVVKTVLAKQEVLVRSLGLDDPLEQEMATQSSILAWEILCTEVPGGLTAHGVAKSQTQLND